MSDTTRSIFKSAAHFLSGTMLSRLTGLGRDILMAAAFGTQSAVAAFLVAFRLAHLLRRLLGEGALQTAFIPHFEKFKQDDPVRGLHFFRDLTLTLTLLLSAIICAAGVAIGGFLAWGDLRPDNREILQLTLFMLPSLLFICLYGVNASLLQCAKKYFTPSVAPCAFNAVWSLGVLCLWNFVPSTAMPWLSLFVTLACVAQWLATTPAVFKILKSQAGFTFRQAALLSKDVKSILKPLFLGIIGISASQINNALDGVFARYAELEGPAFLWYAIRLQQLPLALFGIALSGALLPPLTRSVQEGDAPRFSHFLEYGLKRSLGLMIPITCGIFFMGGSAINLLYGRGDFALESILGTAKCLWAYGFGLIPMTLVILLSPAFYASGDYRSPTIASLASVGVNLALNAWLILFLGLGAQSVAWATSFSAWINVALLGTILASKQGISLSPSFWHECLRVATSTAAGSLALMWINTLWAENPYPTSFHSQLLQVASQALAFASAFLFTAWVCNSEQWNLSQIFLKGPKGQRT